jgi:Periplasmic copper-binding protein (NosD)
MSRLVAQTLFVSLFLAHISGVAVARGVDLFGAPNGAVTQAGIRMPITCGPRNCLPDAGPREGIRCPMGAVRLRPNSRLQEAINSNPEGTTFCFERGTYRLRHPLLPRSGNVFVGRSGAVLTGAKIVSDWRKRNGFWVASRQAQQGAIVQGIGCNVGNICNRPETLFIDGKQLTQVARSSAVRPGRFFFDYAKDRIYMLDDPRGRRVEASVASGAFRATDHYARDVVIKNLRLQHFANPSRTGVIYNTNSPGWTVAFTDVSANHGVGIIHNDGALIHHNKIHHNGQLGLAGYRSEHVTVEANEMYANGGGGFTAWEAGAVKYMRTRDVLLRGNYVHHNTHSGLWMDTDTVDTRYIANTVVANSGPGIFHEISFGAVIRGNFVARNGADGIFISSSSDVEVFENRVVGNRPWGVHLFIDGASGYDLANNHVYDNVIIMRSGTFSGLTTMTVPDPGTYSTSNGNRFQGNAYHVADVADAFWYWSGRTMTWREWRSAGQDESGTAEGLP